MKNAKIGKKIPHNSDPDFSPSNIRAFISTLPPLPSLPPNQTNPPIPPLHAAAAANVP